MSAVLGIDIGGTKIAAALVSPTGGLSHVSVRPTNAHFGGAHVLAEAIRAAREVVDRAPVAAIGIGAGGRIDAATGVVLSATEILPGWAGTDVKSGFAQFGVPVAVDNDVNALACGEHRFGAARGKSIAVFIALGTGVGGALLIDGRLYRGAHSSGAEFGHMLLDTSRTARRPDSAGAVGTLEAYCSGAGLVQTWREITGDNAAAKDGRAIAEEARDDPDGPAARAIERTGEYLGLGLTSLANALDPEVIIIGGGLSHLGDRLLAPARRILRARALPGPALSRVVCAEKGEYASVIGAASLAMPPLQ